MGCRSRRPRVRNRNKRDFFTSQLYLQIRGKFEAVFGIEFVEAKYGVGAILYGEGGNNAIEEGVFLTGCGFKKVQRILDGILIDFDNLEIWVDENLGRMVRASSTFQYPLDVGVGFGNGRDRVIDLRLDICQML